MRPSLSVPPWLCLLLGAAPLTAQPPVRPVTTAAPAPAPRGPRDPAEIAAFMDGLMTSYLREKHIAGATVAVVRDTTVLLARGYGWADAARHVPVDPARTLFRIGSITKPFTWTAVMQLVEQGKLDLDKDINAYLDFKIPDTYPGMPITMRHVLSHTVGLEEDSRELFTEDSARLVPMKAWLPAHIPKRVRPPGTQSSYSNWAAGTAGYIVERISGMPYDDYIDKFVFGPLGMAVSSSRQPLPAALRPLMSTGYEWKGGSYVPRKFEMVNGGWPAGSIASSATDMAAFMIAHLNRGAYRGQRILAESTAVRMQQRIQGHDPRIPGFAHGFYEQTTVGPRGIGHGGDTQWFHSDLMMLPTEGVGVFVSFNTNTGGALSFKPFADDFLAHYYPEPLAPLAPTRDDRVANQRFAGEYLMNRMSYSTFQKAVSLAGSIKIAVVDSGALLAATPLGEMRLVQVDSLLFRDVHSHDLMAFQVDAKGNVTRAFLSMMPMGTIEKVGTLGAPGTHMILLGLGIVVFLGILVSAAVRYFGARSRGAVPADALTTRGRRVMVLASLLVVAFLVGVGILASDPTAYLFSGDYSALMVILALPVLATVATAIGLVTAVMQWMTGAGSTATRVRHTLAVLVALVFMWSLNTWNLLGWRV